MTAQVSTEQKRAAMQSEALQRAVIGQSVMNYGPIFEGFMAKGIPESEIKPRENVFTFNAWKALGRSVRKGEHGVKVVTWITAKGSGDAGELSQTDGGLLTEVTQQARGFRMCKATTVFHVSQTEVRQ